MNNNEDAADFYLGRGEHAAYLGTATVDGAAPEDIEVWARFQSLDDEPVTDQSFQDEVREIVNHYTWPWTDRTDSSTTPWTYMFDRGTLYIYRYGVEMARLVANYTVPTRDHAGRQPRNPVTNQFPIMELVNQR